ncbi:AAA family ATPase, partial [Streptomyces sp. NPDC059627]
MHAADLPTRFLGREPELAVIRRLWDALPDSGAFVQLSGPPGIGKTALLSVCAEDAAARGFQVVRAVGSRAERALSFAALHQLLRPLLAGVEQRPPGQRAAQLGGVGMSDGPAQADP